MKRKSLPFCFFIFFSSILLFSQTVTLPPESRRRLVEDLDNLPSSPSNESSKGGNKSSVGSGGDTDKNNENKGKSNTDTKNNTSSSNDVHVVRPDDQGIVDTSLSDKLNMEERERLATKKKTQKTDVRTITINSARTTEYKKLKGKKKEDKDKTTDTSTDESVPKEDNDKPVNDNPSSERSVATESESTDDGSDNKSGSEDEWEEEELVIFTGGVSISVSDTSSSSTILADKVSYNKTRSTMEAVGHVQFERKIGEQVAEKFVGEYLLFDIQKMQGVFYKGVVQQASNKKGRDPFSIHTYIAGKDASGVIGFKNSFLTTSKSDDSLWSIRASRLWVLPGNELAFANGVLSIGVVPLFYLPFFYYPADEMLFHPVFGFKNREGYFLQTTTYLIGRKPLAKQDKTSSFSNFLQGDALKKQKLEGLFFKKLDENDSIQDPSYLKVMFDMYSRLGYLVGGEGKFKPKRGYVKNIDISAFFSFSNTIYPLSTDSSSKSALFSNFAPGAVKKSALNKSNFFGKVVPFRYNLNFNTSLTREPFNVSINFPFISDPYFQKDFMVRGEDMNWFNYLLNKDKLAKESSSTSEETSYTWKMQGSIRPSFQILKPWVSSFSFDELSTIVNFYSKTNSKLKDQDSLHSPERKFYYPQSAKPIFKASLSGSIFSTTMLEKKHKRKTDKASKNETLNATLQNTLREIENPFEKTKEDEEKEKSQEKIEKASEEGSKDKEGKSQAENKKEGEKEEKTLEEKQAKNKKKKLSEMTPEELQQKEMEITDGLYAQITDNFLPIYKVSYPQSFASYFLNTILKYDLTYKLSGQTIYEATFDHDTWKEAKDINWKKFYSKYYQLKGDASLNSNLSIYKGLLTFTNSFAFASNYQQHPYVKDETKKDTLKLNNYKANVFNLKNTNTLKLSPFVDFDMFKSTSFSWTLTEILLQRKFEGTVDTAKWKIEKFKWKKEFVTSHVASAVLGWSFKGYTQSINLSMNLKPLLKSYSMSASFAVPYFKTGLSVRRFEKEKPDKEKPNQKLFWDPLKFTASLSLPFKVSLSHEYIYNIEDKKHDKASFSVSHSYFSASYVMSRVIPYKLDKATGWKAEGKDNKDKKFIPTSFSFSASSFPLEFYSWKNRVNFKASFTSNLSFNLIRLTDSYLAFSPKLSFGIHEFVDISFGVTSRNDTIVKYFNDTFKLPVEFAGEKNILKDIAYSLFFWDTEKRKQSDFKLKSIDFSLTHNLKDWTMTFSYSIKPILKTEKGKKIYKFDPTISFFVQWNPIGDIKVRAKQEEKKFSVERGEIK